MPLMASRHKCCHEPRSPSPARCNIRHRRVRGSTSASYRPCACSLPEQSSPRGGASFSSSGSGSSTPRDRTSWSPISPRVLPRAAIFQRPTQYKLSALAPLTWDYLRLMSTPRNKRKSAVRESFHGWDGILVLRATRTTRATDCSLSSPSRQCQSRHYNGCVIIAGALGPWLRCVKSDSALPENALGWHYMPTSGPRSLRTPCSIRAPATD
jgi:hypothetical protein